MRQIYKRSRRTARSTHNRKADVLQLARQDELVERIAALIAKIDDQLAR